MTDTSVEATMPGYGPKYARDVADTCRRIAALTNNDATRWEVPAKYQTVARSNADHAALERHDVDRATAALGTVDNPKFVDADGVAFSFWSGLRFGPLIAKE
ncbi:hypothetical protein [Mesorhizobium opportunistum]|uniref:hypothetical protein n=1 Tax=Mesorhizobium opportunistum TaxID=593909 RepID=UPI0025769F41|nr:hypothetical protein [Mesorhizobium opportunistum]WJI40941.1 hypothetical protein NL534_12130 [Mesorhizobium opportunistum]